MGDASVFAGIDVAQAEFVVALAPTGECWAVVNDTVSVRDLAARLQALGPALVVLEATGGLEATLAAMLPEAGLPVAVVNPRQVRDFATATGRLAKTARSRVPQLRLGERCMRLQLNLGVGRTTLAPYQQETPCARCSRSRLSHSMPRPRSSRRHPRSGSTSGHSTRPCGRSPSR